jgi:hypothetical protein
VKVKRSLGPKVRREDLDTAEFRARHGRELTDQWLLLRRCFRCGRLYLLLIGGAEKYPGGTRVFLDPEDLHRFTELYEFDHDFVCLDCGEKLWGASVGLWFLDDYGCPWPIRGIPGPEEFLVTWDELEKSGWRWITERTRQ